MKKPLLYLLTAALLGTPAWANATASTASTASTALTPDTNPADTIKVVDVEEIVIIATPKEIR